MMMPLKLFFMFLKIGFTSFGGGYGMMSMIMDEGNRIVGLTSVEFADMAALDLICSGPVAVNGATYVGYIKAGIIGSITATIGVILPSFIVATMMIIFLNHFYKSKIIKGLFAGITPACGGLMIFTCIVLSKSVFFNADTYAQAFQTPLNSTTIGMLFLFIAAIIADYKFKIDPIWITIAGAIIGAIFLR